ncbi:MAG: hypothetical protein RLZ86_1202, partial [Actinomycetota bacterium]
MPVDVDLVVVGTAYHVPRADRLDVLADHVIAVDMTGVIVDVAPIGDQRADDLVSSARRLVRLEESERLLPGLIDTHI